jgi:hypothetical protein
MDEGESTRTIDVSIYPGVDPWKADITMKTYPDQLQDTVPPTDCSLLWIHHRQWSDLVKGINTFFLVV